MESGLKGLTKNILVWCLARDKYFASRQATTRQMLSLKMRKILFRDRALLCRDRSVVSMILCLGLFISLTVYFSRTAKNWSVSFSHKYLTKKLLKFSLKCAKNKNIRLMKNLKQNYEIWRKCFRPNLTSVIFVFLRRADVALHVLVKILSSFYKQCYQYKKNNIQYL